MIQSKIAINSRYALLKTLSSMQSNRHRLVTLVLKVPARNRYMNLWVANIFAGSNWNKQTSRFWIHLGIQLMGIQLNKATEPNQSKISRLDRVLNFGKVSRLPFSFRKPKILDQSTMADKIRKNFVLREIESDSQRLSTTSILYHRFSYHFEFCLGKQFNPPDEKISIHSNVQKCSATL